MTGEVTPDITGPYEYDGDYYERPSYRLVGNGWFIWWDGVQTWNITDVKGVPYGYFWYRIDENIEGTYEPGGDAIGIPTVTEI